MEISEAKKSLKKAIKGFKKAAPVMLGVMMLVGILNTVITEKTVEAVFTDNIVLNSIIGAFSGSIMAGNPVTSYIISGEMIGKGVGLIAVTAFIVAWVTVGIVQLPSEIEHLGKKFALTRNAVSFVLAIVIAVITAYITGGIV